jgi:hypothetical protein
MSVWAMPIYWRVVPDRGEGLLGRAGTVVITVSPQSLDRVDSTALSPLIMRTPSKAGAAALSSVDDGS